MSAKTLWSVGLGLLPAVLLLGWHYRPEVSVSGLVAPEMDPREMEAPEPPPKPVRFIPVSRVPEVPPPSVDSGLEVAGVVVDGQGRSVERGFISYVASQRGGWCGNDRGTPVLGRVSFSNGQFRFRVTGRDERDLRIVAEDGRSTTVHVDKTGAPLVALTVVLPDHPAARAGSRDSLPWGGPSRPTYPVAVIALPGFDGPGTVAALKKEFVLRLREEGFDVKQALLEPARLKAIRGCLYSPLAERCLPTELGGLGVQSVLVVHPPIGGDRLLPRYALVEVDTGEVTKVGLVPETVTPESVARSLAHQLAEERLRGEKWGPIRSGPPQNACEYLAGTRFEAVVKDEPPAPTEMVPFGERGPRGYQTFQFTRSRRLWPLHLSSDPSVSLNRGDMFCDGWKVVYRNGGGDADFQTVAVVDPETGRMTMDGMEYVRAGLAEEPKEL